MANVIIKNTAYFIISLMLGSAAVGRNDQQPAPETVEEEPIKVEVHLVNIEARVTREGQPVKDLTRDDFVLKESGKEQEIAFFYYVEAPAQFHRGLEPPPGKKAASQTVQDLNPEGSNPASSYEGPTDPVPQAAGSTDPTWIHLVTEAADPVEFRRTAKAIRQFIENELRPGFYISLGGMPFTDNKAILLSTLSRLEGHPYSMGSGIDPSMIHLKDLEVMRNIAIAIPFAPDIVSIEDALQTTAMFDGPLEEAPVIGVETVNRQIRFFGELAMLRYMDLVERMALLPGRKSIVVFRNGLRLDHETSPILERLLSMAARNRVSFYTVDSRGLDVISPVKDLRFPLAWSRGRLEKYLPDPLGETTRRREAEEGLVVLAKETGGYAVLDSNDMGTILSKVVDDSFSYYVLGYYPENFTRNGRFRKINLSLKEKNDFEIKTVRGYSEPRKLRLQSRAERLVSLRKSLQVPENNELDVHLQPEIFAGPDGSPILFVSVGAPAAEFDLKKGQETSRVEGEILLQIVNSYSQKIPLYHNGRIDEDFDNVLLAEDDPPFVNYQTVLPLSPGLYELRAIIRDKRTGKYGVNQAVFLVNNFNSASVPSSLLLTRYTTASSKEKADPEDWHAIVLSAGETGYYPQPNPRFRKGEIVHVLFHLYRPTEEDREWAGKGMQIGIFRNNSPVTGINARGQAFMDSGEDIIRYSAMFDTSTLVPGEYSFMALLPNYDKRKVPHLEEAFSVVED